MRALRARVDAVVIGAANLRADDPDLMPNPLRVVVTRAGDHISPAAKMFDKRLGGEAIVVHTAMMSRETRAALAPLATLVELGTSDVDILRLTQWLLRERGCKSLVCEGGGVLAADFFAAKAVDELHLTIVSRVLGGANAPTCVGGTGFEPDAIPDGQLQSVERAGDELYLVYTFPW